MSLNIGELIFLDQLAERFKIKTPKFLVEPVSSKILKSTLEGWGKGVVKPDILTGKREKAGSVKKVDNYVDAQKYLRKIASTDINGIQPRTAYITQYIPAKMEIYSAITYNSRYLSPSLTISIEGGVDIENVGSEKKATIPVDVFTGLSSYQAYEMLDKLNCPKEINSILSRLLVNQWDMFISTGMKMCEINPWRITPDNEVYACDFKAEFDEANYKSKNPGFVFHEYPEIRTPFEEEMDELGSSSYRGQTHVSYLGGDLILPILFGGGASTIITETLFLSGGSPIFLSDFGGNPPYERIYKSAEICFKYFLKDASLLLILGGKANNTYVDVTFAAIADALKSYFEINDPVDIPVIIGRGGPRLVKGMIILRETLESLDLPYVMFGFDTPITMVAEYAAKLAKAYKKMRNKNK